MAKSSNILYAVGVSFVCGLVFLLYKNQMRTVSSVNNVYIQSPPSHGVLKGAFSEPRRKVVHEQAFQPLVIPTERNSSFDYQFAMNMLNEAKVSQDDPRLIKLIRDYYIEPPSDQAYNLLNPERLEYSNGQTPFIDSRLNYMEGGFYVECGALNGEKGSNTLFFEKVRKWNGVLIEADPETYKALKSKNRKAFTMNTCLSPQPYPAQMTFNRGYNRGRVVHNDEARNWVQRQRIKKDEIQIQCFPLYSILMALNQHTLDFFSLDIEGDELNVLKTVPWDKLDVRMLTVEVAHGSSSSVKRYVEQQGYDSMLQVSRWDGGVNDVIFRKKGLTH